jgi:hypothetical protein
LRLQALEQIIAGHQQESEMYKGRNEIRRREGLSGVSQHKNASMQFLASRGDWKNA